MPASIGRRPHVTLATAGHVDHGKSTLLRALTGTDPDRLPDERRRGLTIELGFVWCTLEATGDAHGNIEVAFVDVPGHERFVATMLAGVGPATASLLVIAADDGWSAQTQEHAEVLALLDTPIIATVLSKTAVAGRVRANEVAGQVADRLRAMGLDGGPLVHTDAVAGIGLDHLRWVLRERIPALPGHSGEVGARLWIDRSFVVVGAGPVVTGTLGGGTLRVGDRVHVEPGAVTARVRSLASLGTQIEVAHPGERVAVNLAGVDHDQLARGQMLVTGPGVPPAGVVDGWAQLLAGRTVRDRGAWHLHAGTARTTARLLPFPDPIATAAADIGMIGGQGAVRLVLERPLPLIVGDVIIVRDAGRGQLVGAIRVADPGPLQLPRGRRCREVHARMVHAAAQTTGHATIASLVALHGGVRRVDDLRATARCEVRDPTPDGLLRLGAHLVDVALMDRWRHALDTLGPGTHDRGMVARVLHEVGMPDLLTGPMLDRLVHIGALAVTDAGYALPGHADLDARRRAARRAALVRAVEETLFTPPPIEEVVHQVGADARDVAALVRQRRLVRAGPVTFSGLAVEEARRRLTASPLAGRAFTAGEARDVLNTSRRYIIPLLEHLATTGVTSFDGTHHRLR